MVFLAFFQKKPEKEDQGTSEIEKSKNGREHPPEALCPPDGEQRVEEREDVPIEGPSLDSTGVVPCPTHGMDHLTWDPSCEFCKRALGPLYRHLKGNYGTRLDDQTPTLSFDFSGPFPGPQLVLGLCCCLFGG